MSRALPLTLLALSLALLGACGDDDTDGSSTSTMSNGATSNGTTDATSNGTTGGGWDLGFPCRQLPMGEDGWIYVYGLRDLDGDLEPESVGAVDITGHDGSYVRVIYDESGQVPQRIAQFGENGATVVGVLTPIGEPLDTPVNLGGSLPTAPEGLVILSYFRVEVSEVLEDSSLWSLNEVPAPAENTNDLWGCGWEGQ